ncbi:MAG: glycosyltransferase [Candidatus Limnocylindrales bacterium]
MTETSSQQRRDRRVAYLVTSSGMGGAEREVCYLAQAFHRRGWEVAAISMLPLERPVSELEAEGIYTSSLGMRRGLPDPRALGRLRGFIRRWQPDVLHAHMVHANLLARLSRLVVKTPVVISTIHSQDEGAQWRYVAYRLTDRLSDLTTTVSQVAMAEAIRRGAVRPDSILLVPNGIGTSAYVRDASIRERIRASLGLGDRFTWLAVGRLVEAKGYLDMLAAFRQVREHHPDAVLMIAGNGPLEELIRTTARQAGIEHGVTLLGLRQDVPALMQAADAFVMSSKWEGLPMVLLEAGASSLPIVATDVGGGRDAILDGVSGHLTPAGDPVALAQAMCHVMELRVRDREAMGAAGRGHICRTFDIEVVVDMWEALYAGAGSVRAHGSPAL